MKKKELLHYHGLMCLVKDHIEHWEDDADFSTYEESISVRPKQIHKPKGDHKEAVQTLVDEATDSINDGSDVKEKDGRELSQEA